MRTYVTMNEMEDYIKKGKDIFIKMIGNKTIEYTKFIDNFDKANKKFYNFPSEKLGTKRGKKVADDFRAYRSVEILILSTMFHNQPMNAYTIDFMYDNYDKERALRYFDSKGYDVYMKQKNEAQNSENITPKIENEQIKIQPESKQVYNNGNYIELE